MANIPTNFKTSHGGKRDYYVDETYICNLALGKIGEYRISHMSEQSQPARWCKRFYHHCRDKLLRSHKWNFATGYATLSRVANVPQDYTWLYGYLLPDDFLRMIDINGWQETEWHDRWEICREMVLTDAEAVQIYYTRRVIDPGSYDPLFVEALSLELAAKIVKPMTGSQSEMQAILQELNALELGRTTRTDSSEKRAKRKPAWVTSALVQSRFR